MRILISPDSFKGSLASQEVADAIERGIKKVSEKHETIKIPIADGGDGTLDCIMPVVAGEIIYTKVVGPLGEEISAPFGVMDNGNTAFIEMAKASGLPLLQKEMRKPLITTTYGTGQLIKKALEIGCKRIIIGLGGSATNDGGVGMAQALGARFLDKYNNEVGFGGGNLYKIDKIDISTIDSRLKNVSIEAACDVTNPLYGPNGASYVYGPQKGADINTIKILDENLKHLAKVISEQLKYDIKDVPGSGAAGGMGAGIVTFLGGTIRKGIDIMIDITDLEKKVQYADLIFSGEGRIDNQILNGKTIYGISKLAKKYNIPIVAIVGNINDDAYELYGTVVDGIESIIDKPMDEIEAFTKAPLLIEKAAERALRLILINVQNKQ
jgi:glycerate kinase